MNSKTAAQPPPISQASNHTDNPIHKDKNEEREILNISRSFLYSVGYVYSVKDK